VKAILSKKWKNQFSTPTIKTNTSPLIAVILTHELVEYEERAT